MLTFKCFVRMVSNQKMAGRSGEKYGFTAKPYTCIVTKTSAIDSFIISSREQFWFFILFNSCKYLKSNHIVYVVIRSKKIVLIVKIAKKFKLVWVCRHWNQVYATRRTCLQFNFESFFQIFTT